ncbi:helix-turn-helix domain-containing protein [Aquipuribacter sp. SD81]|uniref:helix-turn-helix domain-containing protein n=1 Tax=Aquipuribacter sp. SD81 TaxID=3127703 RepID=UPI0030171B3F
MKVLDTRSLPAADRAPAYQEAVSANCTRSLASFEDESGFHARCHVQQLGAAKVFTIDALGMTLRRSARTARGMNDCPVAVALPMRTTNRLERGRDDRQTFGARDLMLVDLSSPYVYGWSGAGASYALHVELDELAVPMDAVRRASERLESSPLYGLVRDHVHRVMTTAEELAAAGAGAEVGAASVELIRALVVSAGGDPRRDESFHNTLRARVEAYVRAHLRDPDLSPARIAAANAISLRTLYKLYQGRDRSLEQVIIAERLAGARADLARTSLRHRTIAAVAASWGFSNASFFTSRFSQAFGVTPREWRAMQQATQQPGASLPSPRNPEPVTSSGPPER